MEKTALTAILITVLWSTTCCVALEHIFINQKMTWSDAQKFCRDHFTDLLTVMNEDEMKQLLQEQGDNVTGWIGLTRDTKIFQNWLWSDNRISEFRDWGPGEPSNEAGHNCVEIEEGKWNDISCNDKLPFFCSQVMRNFVVVDETMTWEEALVYCRTNYKDLVSIMSLKELMVVQYKIGLAQGTYWWMGLRYLGDSWMWVNGDPLGANAVLLSQCPLAPFQCWALNKNFFGQGRSCEEQLGFICLSW